MVLQLMERAIKDAGTSARIPVADPSVRMSLPGFACRRYVLPFWNAFLYGTSLPVTPQIHSRAERVPHVSAGRFTMCTCALQMPRGRA